MMPVHRTPRKTTVGGDTVETQTLDPLPAANLI